MLAALGDKNGESVTESDLRSTSFWNDANRINWNVSSVIGDTVGNPWMLPNQRSALPIHRKEQIDYKDLVEMTVTISSPIQYKSLLGLYGYKLNITLGGDLNFGGDTIPPLFNVASFNGNSHTISNFTLKNDASMSGLLANVKDSVFDLKVEIKGYIATTTTSEYAGVLVGKLDGKMWNCHVSNTSGSNITVPGINHVGGLVGKASGSISNCSVSKIDVNASGQFVGGLAGYVGGDVTDCKVTDGIVSGNLDVGGLVGSHSSSGALTNDTIVHVYVTARNGQAGGLAAISGATVTNCRIDSSSVSGKNSVGGLIGYFTGTISNCHADSLRVKANGDYAGGFYGFAGANGAIEIGSIRNAIIKAENGNAGGLSANGNNGDISNVTVAKVRVSATLQAGGLSASTGGNITICRIDSSSVKGLNNVGGLAGYFSGKISNCHADSLRVIATGNFAGGFYGFAEANGAIEIGSIRNAIITAEAGNAGGLSANGNNGDISSVTVAKVRVSATLQAGGLSASTGGNITSCSIDSSTVEGLDNVGGLAGYFSGNISDCHADSLRVIATGNFAGGFYGFAEANGAIEIGSIRDAIITAEAGNAGGLSGDGKSGNISNVTVAKVRVSATLQAGGLSASTGGNITSCSIDSSTVEGGSNAGGLAGFLGGTANGCSVDSLTITGNYAGGIYGWGTGSAAYDTIMRVNIKAGTSAGGIAGYSTNSTGSNRTFANLQIESASITSNGDCAGGVVGYTDDKEDIFTNINITSITVEAVNYAGGIAGNTLGGSDKITDVEITNYSINATASGSYAGGIVASFAGNSIARCTVKGINTYTISIKGGSQVGGIVADAKMPTSSGNNITDCHISDAALTLSGSKDYIGGIAGYCTMYYLSSCTVVNVAFYGGGKYVGGIVGQGGGHEISANIVSNSSITTTNTNASGTGGIVGHYSGNYITRCVVMNNTTITGGTQTGGIAGFSSSSITNCHVDDATLEMQGTSNFGGIVGYSAGAVNHNLVSATSMKCNNTNAGAAYIGGIVGYNKAGDINNCVAMLEYFDIKAKYTKNGQHLGRIVAKRESGSAYFNYGWVETHIKYYHKRFGINWDNDYCKGTGETAQHSRNGDNLYVGDIYSGASHVSNSSTFWQNTVGFGTEWFAIATPNPYYPKLNLDFVINSTLNNLSKNRGFEYETKLINGLTTYSTTTFTHSILDNILGYNPNNIDIHTPQILFAKTFSTSGQPAVQGQDVGMTLYTDITLVEDNNKSGDTPFWSVDLNGARSGTITASPFVFTTASAGTSLTFDGKGHCIDNFYKVDYSVSNYEGLISPSDNINFYIKRLELENPIFEYLTGDKVLRFGFLVNDYLNNENYSIHFEDIYIKSPVINVVSKEVIWNNTDVTYLGTVGSILGRGNKVYGEKMALYMPNPPNSYIHSYYAAAGGFIGYVRTYTELSKIALSMARSLHYANLDLGNTWDVNLSNIYTVSAFKGTNENGTEYDYQSVTPTGFLIGSCPYQPLSYTLSDNIKMSDGADAIFNQPGLFYAVPFIYKLNMRCVKSTVEFPNWRKIPTDDYLSDFHKTLSLSGLSTDSNWHYPGNNEDIDKIYLNRDEKAW